MALSIINKLMLSFALLLVVSTSSIAAARDLVLVVSSESQIEPLTQLEVRKLFLGYPVSQSGVQLAGVRNLFNDNAYEVFLQKTIRMSSRNYERQLVSKTFRTGSAQLMSAKDIEDLLEMLAENPGRISFMWRDEVEGISGVQIIQTLYGVEP